MKEPLDTAVPLQEALVGWKSGKIIGSAMFEEITYLYGKRQEGYYIIDDNASKTPLQVRELIALSELFVSVHTWTAQSPFISTTISGF